MEVIRLDKFWQEGEGETLIPDPSVPRVFDWEKPLLDQQQDKYSAMDENEESSADDMICNSGSRLIPNGLTKSSLTEEVVLFINAGSQDSPGPNLNKGFVADKYFQGGDVFLTNECITEGGDFSFIYQSARLGSFSYQFDNLPPGDYFLSMINSQWMYRFHANCDFPSYATS